MFLDQQELRAYLIAAARAGESVTYSEALASQGYAFTRPKMRALCSLLGDIDAENRAIGAPELAVLVVRQSDGLPGQGWWTALSKGSHDPIDYSGPWEGPDARRYIDKLQQRVFAYWSNLETDPS